MADLTEAYKPLALSTLKPATGYARPFFFTPNLVTVAASALEVMTDLRFVPAGTIGAEVDVEAATQKMIARGLRLLLVIDLQDDVIGLITSRDLIGDRPTEVMERRGLPFGELRVRELMTPAAQIEVLPLDAVLHAHVGDVVATLRHSGRQHALVVEEDGLSGKTSIRGIFSATQIARQLGIALQQHELTQTFAEIDRAITARAEA